MIAAYFPGMAADGYSSLLIQINIEFSGHDKCSFKKMDIVIAKINAYILYILYIL